ncbi:MAG: response regulator [Candidatus Micrarchaeota archaeon]
MRKMINKATETGGDGGKAQNTPISERAEGFRKVLMVARDGYFREQFAKIIAKQIRRLGVLGNISFVGTSSGSEALELLRKGGIDLVITSQKTSDIEGVELTRRIMAIDSNAKVIIASGDWNGNWQKEGLEAGAVAVVNKPVGDFDDFCLMIAAGMDLIRN